VAGRYRYAVTNQLSLDWFNRHLPAGQKLHEVALLEEQGLGCYVRNDPALPVQRILRTLLRMKMSGEMDRLIEKYNGQIN
jgi:ABC-type amino acid transport substrate-binding protein